MWSSVWSDSQTSAQSSGGWSRYRPRVLFMQTLRVDLVYDAHTSCQVTLCPEACQFPMGPPGLGVIPAPTASRDHSNTLTASLSEISTNCSCRLMEMSFSSVHPQDSSLLFDCESLLEKPLVQNLPSDLGYISASSSLSPTSSVDSFCFSPISLQALGNEPDALNSFFFGTTVEPHSAQQIRPRSNSATITPMKKSRSRYPGKKRQTASEREKLRMRDLTRALNHLRTYLPPSVAPPGQTLTKIETLRFTIRYISYLSEQLGLSEEVLQQRRSSMEQVQTMKQFLDEPTTSSQERCDAVSTQQMSSLQHSCQVSDGRCVNREQYWKTLDQPDPLTFTTESTM